MLTISPMNFFPKHTFLRKNTQAFVGTFFNFKGMKVHGITKNINSELQMKLFRNCVFKFHGIEINYLTFFMYN